MIDRTLKNDLASQYRSRSQIARVTTERWILDNISCPRCGFKLSAKPNNEPGIDFACIECEQTYQLKSYLGRLRSFLLGAEYRTTLAIFGKDHPDRPDLLVLRCARHLDSVEVVELIHYRKENIDSEKLVVARKPLSNTARRAGWQGCKLNLNNLEGTVLVDDPNIIMTDSNVL